MSVHDSGTLERILVLIRNKKYALCESQKDIARLEKEAKMFVQGIIEKAAMHIESGKEINKVILRKYDSKVAYEWDGFRVNRIKVRFKVTMGEEEEILLIISCKCKEG